MTAQRSIKLKTCVECGTDFPPFNTTQKVCSLACALLFARKKGVKKQEKQNRQDLIKFNRNDRRWQLKQTQRSFNRLRKLEEFKWFEDRGLEPECISCGKTKMDWCCGHFKTVGSSPGLRFDKKNTYLQCNRYCNSALSGNIEGNSKTRGYKKGLIERFGQEQANEIFAHCEKEHRSDWTCEQLEEMRKDFNRQIRELER